MLKSSYLCQIASDASWSASDMSEPPFFRDGRSEFGFKAE